MKKIWKTGALLLAYTLLLTGCSFHEKSMEGTTFHQEDTQKASVDYSEGLNKNGFLKKVKAEEIVTLCDYSNLVIPRTEIEANEDMVSAQIDYLIKETIDNESQAGTNDQETGKADGEEASQPKLTDSFVKDHFYETYGVSTVKDFKERIRQDLRSRNEKDYIWNYLLDHCQFSELPEDVVEQRLEIALESLREDYADSMGYDDEKILSVYGLTSMDALKEQLRPDTEKKVKRYLISNAIAQKEAFSVGEAEIQKYIGDDSVEEYYELYGEPYVKAQILLSMVSDYIAGNATLK